MSVTVIYPGTFDPITNGHIDLCQRALKMFDEVVVGVADNPVKSPFFSVQERVELAQLVFADEPRVSVKPFSGLLIDFARSCDSHIILRGLRAISDFEFEVQLAGMNRRLANEIETIFLNAAEDYAFISSSLVREIARLDGNVADFVHPIVLNRLQQKLREKK